MPKFKSTLQKESRKFISIIIPARDEEDAIAGCLKSLQAQNYPQDQFEIILVDDYSEDNTTLVAASLQLHNLKIISMSDVPLREGEVAYKKRAIEAGVQLSRGNIIVTTDADCTHHPKWIGTIENAFEQLQIDMLSGPVLFEFEDNLFERFQALDFIGMIGITAASLDLGMFNLANGANLAFRKSVFEDVGGYTGIDKKASGDDMLLIYKFAQHHPEKVKFLKSKEACVYTRPTKTLKEFIHQRLRWTSKSFSYQDKRITWILAFVYITNAMLPIHLVMFLITFKGVFLVLLVSQFFAMSAVDLLFLKNATRFFDRRQLLKGFLASQIFHIGYILSIGLLGNVVSYKWKGRKLK